MQYFPNIFILLFLLGALNVRFKLKQKIQLSILLGSHNLGRLNMRLTSDSLNGGLYILMARKNILR